MKKARRFPTLSFSEKPSLTSRLCEHDGCDSMGDFRAPKNPLRLQDYYWFCLEHVREYNKTWDFYRGITPQEIEASRISDVTWNRPSWPIGGWHTILENAHFCDGIDPFLKTSFSMPALPSQVQKALGVLDLSYPVTLEVLKTQYKKLAKRHHPDLHGGAKEAEERLKTVNEAYQIVKKYLGE